MATVSMDMDESGELPDMPTFGQISTTSFNSRSSSPPPPRRRDTASSIMASSVWSKGGESYTEQYARMTGSPGQDLSRYTEGPARYLNGAPNTGSKAMLEKTVLASPRGRWNPGVNHGPAQFTKLVTDRKVVCRRSNVGPDPYGISRPTTFGHPTKQLALAVAKPLTSTSTLSFSARQPYVYGTTAVRASDPYHLGTRNTWKHTSNSIKSILAHPMPQTPAGSPLIPLSPRQRSASISSSPGASPRTTPRTPGGYSRMRPSQYMEGLSQPGGGIMRSSGNPFH